LPSQRNYESCLDRENRSLELIEAKRNCTLSILGVLPSNPQDEQPILDYLESYREEWTEGVPRTDIGPRMEAWLDREEISQLLRIQRDIHLWGANSVYVEVEWMSLGEDAGEQLNFRRFRYC
jgi:hypothetical protein